MPFATLEQVAGVLNLTPRRVQQLVKQEGMPRVSRGEYDLVRCVHWYIAHLSRRIEEAGRGTTETESQARARYIASIADLREMDVAERRGTLVRNEDAIRVFEPVIAALKARMLSVPRRVSILVAPDGSDERYRVESLVEALVREILEEVSVIPEKVRQIGEKKRRRWAVIEQRQSRDKEGPGSGEGKGANPEPS